MDISRIPKSTHGSELEVRLTELRLQEAENGESANSMESAESPESAQSAASRVFGIAELLEEILLHTCRLEVSDIFKGQQGTEPVSGMIRRQKVSRTFAAVTRGSPKLQQLAFFDANDISSSERARAAIQPLRWLLLTMERFRDCQLLDDSFRPHRIQVWPPTRAGDDFGLRARLNPELLQQCAEKGGDRLQRLTMDTLPVSWQYEKASWKSLPICGHDMPTALTFDLRAWTDRYLPVEDCQKWWRIDATIHFERRETLEVAFGKICKMLRWLEELLACYRKFGKGKHREDDWRACAPAEASV